jgi:hypothetical protein
MTKRTHRAAPQRHRHLLRILLAVILLLCVAATPAHAAYVDPGSGSLLLQAILAGFLGLVFFFRQSVARLLRLFRRSRPASEEPPSDIDRRSE